MGKGFLSRKALRSSHSLLDPLSLLLHSFPPRVLPWLSVPRVGPWLPVLTRQCPGEKRAAVGRVDAEARRVLSPGSLSVAL